MLLRDASTLTASPQAPDRLDTVALYGRRAYAAILALLMIPGTYNGVKIAIGRGETGGLIGTGLLILALLGLAWAIWNQRVWAMWILPFVTGGASLYSLGASVPAALFLAAITAVMAAVALLNARAIRRAGSGSK